MTEKSFNYKLGVDIVPAHANITPAQDAAFEARGISIKSEIHNLSRFRFWWMVGKELFRHG